MPIDCFTLIDSTSPPLEVSWDWRGFFVYTNITLKLGGRTIGTIPTEDQMSDYVFSLADGSSLTLHLHHSRLQALQNNQRLRKCPCIEQPQTTLERVHAQVISWGWIWIAMGVLVALLWPRDLITYLSATSLGALGIIYLFLGTLIKSKSILALIMAIGIFVINIGLMFILLQHEELEIGSLIHWLILIANFAITLRQGLSALVQLRREPETGSPDVH